MSTLLTEEVGASVSGGFANLGNIRFFQSTYPDIILYAPIEAKLAKAANGRYQFGVNAYHQQVTLPGGGNTTKITGGSSVFSITSGVQLTTEALNKEQEKWRAHILGSGMALTTNPKFQQLNVRNGEAQVVLGENSGKADQAHNDKAVGTPGGVNSFLVNLTELGAQEWVQGITDRTPVPGIVKYMYEYLAMMPTVGAKVKVYGKRLFTHLSAALDVSVQGFWYGGSAKIEAEWEKMTRTGAVEITFIGSGLSPELEQMRQKLVTSFAEQARQQLFNSLFQPAPTVTPAKAGSTKGVFGGANFALKWKRQEEATDLELEINFEGWTWLKASMDANLAALCQELDRSYVTEVHTQQSFPATLTVDGYADMLKSVAVSWSASEGKAPEAPVFGADGGSQTYVVTSRKPQDVKIDYRAKVSFAAPKWPIIETAGSATVAKGGNQIVIRPSAWIGHHKIFMFLRDGDRILGPSELNADDYLVANVSYTAPHLTAAIKDSARITPIDVLEFNYPLDPKGTRGVAKFSAFGVIDGKLVRSNGEQTISFEEEAVFILASKDKIELVSQSTVLPESDELAQRLLASPLARLPQPSLADDTTEPVAEVEGPQPQTNGHVDGQYASSNGHNALIVGTAVALEYGSNGPALVVQTDSGKQQRVLLHNGEVAEALEERRRRVSVTLDETGTYADQIRV
ncbi:MAG: hypothetical protein M3442_00230, partial [Chloroflexota bacterium]|nr:hypothetical protein [Chloroflexota bacterium]